MLFKDNRRFLRHDPSMPRYYFHVVNNTSSVVDEEGSELADLAAAYVQARKTIGGIIADEVVQGDDVVNLVVMIDDARGVRLATITAATTITCSEEPRGD
jgi:hypothetical protein